MSRVARITRALSPFVVLWTDLNGWLCPDVLSGLRPLCPLFLRTRKVIL